MLWCGTVDAVCIAVMCILYIIGGSTHYLLPQSSTPGAAVQEVVQGQQAGSVEVVQGRDAGRLGLQNINKCGCEEVSN